MQSIASLTGGRAHINNNDLEGVIAESMQSGSSYYTLAYRPTAIEWNGKFRKITLKTSRRDVRLLYRSGYYATPDVSESERRSRPHCRDGDAAQRAGLNPIDYESANHSRQIAG